MAKKWLPLQPYGEVIEGTKILPFKVPLKKSKVDHLPEEKRFTPTVLIANFPKLKYVIDLTQSLKYYDPMELMQAGIKYQKVMIPGQAVPKDKYFVKFFEAMKNFSDQCGDDEIIGVHCTHGINRTGYLICRYLVEQLGWSLSDALQKFTKARGYQIRRAEYKKELHTRYGQPYIETNVHEEPLMEPGSWRRRTEPGECLPNRTDEPSTLNTNIHMEPPRRPGSGRCRTRGRRKNFQTRTGEPAVNSDIPVKPPTEPGSWRRRT